MQDDFDFRQIAEFSVDTILRIERDGIIVYASPSCQDLFAYTPEDMTQLTVFDIIHPEELPRLLELRKLVLSAGNDRTPLTLMRWIRKGGATVWAEGTSRVIRDPHTGRTTALISMLRDATERKALEDKLAQLATTDPLTGLHNRRSFDQALEHEWQRTLRAGSPTSLLLIDVDHFKLLNDRYGHTVGDDCLCAVAGAVSGAVRRSTDLVARYGGEELAAILTDTDYEGALRVAEAVRRSIEALRIPHQDNRSGHGYITASIGVGTAIARHGGSSKMPEALIESADRALYKAKRSGRNCVAGGLLLTATA
jgi:diguanylate cyclase (GGDEF)-like protein/PAS domain S-box-containing protein